MSLSFDIDEQTLCILNNINDVPLSGMNNTYRTAITYKLYSDVYYTAKKHEQMGFICDDADDKKVIISDLVALGTTFDVHTSVFDFSKNNVSVYLFTGDEVLQKIPPYMFDSLYFNLCSVTFCRTDQIDIVNRMVKQHTVQISSSKIFGITPELLHEATK